MDWSTCQVETAACSHVGHAIDLHKHDPKRVLEKYAAETASANASAALSAQHWLPFAAEKYRINPNIRDYAIVPVIIMPSDLPNKNYVGFPFRALSEFVPSLGMLAYESWKGQPTHQDHVNDNIEIAKGVVLDTSMTPMKHALGDLWKVNALLAFDREKDPMLVNKILTEQSHYSMGAYVTQYACSICGCTTQNKFKPNCEHHKVGVPSEFATVPSRNRMGIPELAYWNVESFKGFEVSWVPTPAFISAADNQTIRNW
jgi:hypothetical protein